MPTDASHAPLSSLQTPFNESHEAAVAAGVETLSAGGTLLLASGPRAWGRVAVLDEIASRLPDEIIVERIEGAPLDITTLTGRLGGALGVPIDDGTGDLRAIGASLTEALAALEAEDRRIALLIDAGDGASARALLLLERLCRSNALSAVVVARGALCTALLKGNDTRLKALAESAAVVRYFTREEIDALAADPAFADRLWGETNGAPEAVWALLPQLEASMAVESVELRPESEDALEDVWEPDAPSDAGDEQAVSDEGPDAFAEPSDLAAKQEQSDKIDEAAAELTESLEQAMAARDMAPEAANSDDADSLWLDEGAPRKRRSGMLLGGAAAALVAAGVIGVLEAGVLDPAPLPAVPEIARTSSGLAFDMRPELPEAPAPVTEVAAVPVSEPQAPEAAREPDLDLETADPSSPADREVARAPRPAPRPQRDGDVAISDGEVETANALRAVAETAYSAASAGAEALASAGVMSDTLDGVAAGANERRVALSRARQLESLDGDAVEQRVRAALILADRRIAVKQYTEPSGVSAYDVLLNAWEVAPTDARLNKRFNRLVEVYRGEARRALSQERFSDFYRFNSIVDRIQSRRPV